MGSCGSTVLRQHPEEQLGHGFHLHQLQQGRTRPEGHVPHTPVAVPPKPTPNPMANPFPKSLPPNGSAADTSPIPTQPKPILLKTQSTDYVVLASSPPPGHQSVIPLPPTPACSPPPNSGHIPGMLASPPIRVRLHKISESYPGGWANNRAAPLPFRHSRVWQDEQEELDIGITGFPSYPISSPDSDTIPAVNIPPPEIEMDSSPEPTTSEDDAFASLTSPRKKTTHLPEIDVEDLMGKLQGAAKTEEKARLLALRGGDAIDMLDTLQSWLDKNLDHKVRRRVLRLLVDIASASNELPQSLFITGVEIESRDPTSFGSFADVFRGTYDGKVIALKRLRINERGQKRIVVQRKFCKEGLVWRQLVHPNILPFIGVDGQTFKETTHLGMVSLWMERGTVMDYIRSNQYNPQVHRQGLIIGVAEGLQYLHAQGMAHGDLHGSNIFITKDGQACLADFGLTVIGDMTLTRVQTTAELAGATRWLAPELLDPDVNISRKTPAGDVFAFGRLCLAICTTRQPFHDTPDMAVLFLIMKGLHPSRPTEADCGGFAMSDELWDISNECWATAPQDRPDMSSILSALRSGNADG